jgi:hypothetical protein
MIFFFSFAPGCSNVTRRTLSRTTIVPRFVTVYFSSLSVVSGWAVQQESGEVREAGIEYVLPKPCPLQDLLETVQKALHGAAVSRV